LPGEAVEADVPPEAVPESTASVEVCSVVEVVSVRLPVGSLKEPDTSPTASPVVSTASPTGSSEVWSGTLRAPAQGTTDANAVERSKETSHFMAKPRVDLVNAYPPFWRANGFH
jgi:hypothetical protein